MMTRPTLLVYTGTNPDCSEQVCSQALNRGWLPIGPATERETNAHIPANQNLNQNQKTPDGTEMLAQMVSLLKRADALLLPFPSTEPEKNSIAATLDMEAAYRVVPVYRCRNGELLPLTPAEPFRRPTVRETLEQVMHLNGRNREILETVTRRGGATKDELREITSIPVSTIRASLRNLENKHLIFRTAYGSTPGTIQRRIFLTSRGEDVADLLPMAGRLRGMNL